MMDQYGPSTVTIGDPYETSEGRSWDVYRGRTNVVGQIVRVTVNGSTQYWVSRSGEGVVGTAASITVAARMFGGTK